MNKQSNLISKVHIQWDCGPLWLLVPVLFWAGPSQQVEDTRFTRLLSRSLMHSDMWEEDNDLCVSQITWKKMLAWAAGHCIVLPAWYWLQTHTHTHLVTRLVMSVHYCRRESLLVAPQSTVPYAAVRWFLIPGWWGTDVTIRFSNLWTIQCSLPAMWLAVFSSWFKILF